jgi:adenosine/AMP kinase
MIGYTHSKGYSVNKYRAADLVTVVINNGFQHNVTSKIRPFEAVCSIEAA